MKKQIADQHLQPGSPLPSESELMARYSVSRTTIRHAIDHLVRIGAVVRVQGKGTFVAGPSIQHDLYSLQALSQALTHVGLKPQVSVIDLEFNPDIPLPILTSLKLDNCLGTVRIKRLHSVENVPVVYAVAYLSSRFQWRFTAADLTQQSIYGWLAEKEHTQIESLINSIRASAADAEVAEYLGLGPGDPVLHVLNSAMTRDGTPVDHTDLYFPPDRYALTARLRPLENGISIAMVYGDSSQPQRQPDPAAKD